MHPDFRSALLTASRRRTNSTGPIGTASPLRLTGIPSHRILAPPHSRALSLMSGADVGVDVKRPSSFQSLDVTGTIPRDGLGIAVGQFAGARRTFTEAEIDVFGCLVSDRNPLHSSWPRPNAGLDGGAAATATEADEPPGVLLTHPLVRWDDDTGKSRVLVHGLLVSSLFTCILGTRIPGAVYLHQTLEFVRPVYSGEVVAGTLTVVEARPWGRRPGLHMTCDTIVARINDDATTKVCVKGQAQVWLPAGTLLDPTTAAVQEPSS